MFRQIFIRNFFFILFIFPAFSFAEIHPANGAAINATQVMFEYDFFPGANNYKIFIETDDRSSPVSLVVKNRSLACIVPDLQFGRNYRWYYEAYRNKRSLFKSETFRFTINSYPLIDSSLYRVNVEVAKRKKFSDDIIFLDFLGVAIDRKGKPVWFYPSSPSNGRIEPNYRNMRMTYNGSITFQDNDNCYESDLTGKILWKAPNDGRVSGDKREFYHHDFRKLKDGTYLTTSYQYVQEPNFFKPSVISKVRYNTLIQYDAQGKILWTWNEKDHVKKEVLFQGLDSNSTEVEGTHLNGFDYDEKENAIAMSFRNNSSILKIDRKTGKIIYDLSPYGAQSGRKDPWFARQHGPIILPGHRLLIYNNNAKDTITQGEFPKILVIQEPANGKRPEILWEFECSSDHYPKGITGKEGYVTQLPNEDFLVAMGTANFAFEVTPKKEIVWEAYFQRFDETKKEWIGFNNYRCTASSSLYPKYFTVQPSSDKNGIQINNEGTDADNYRFDVLLDDGKTRIFSDSISLKGRSSATIPVATKYKSNKEVYFVVTSSSGGNFSKMLTHKPEDN